MLTDEQIERAKARTKYGGGAAHHEHNDCIRIAHEWLDAQRTIKGTAKSPVALKHLIENWGGRYVSQSDVEVAAELHSKIRGSYPLFNLSARLIRPSKGRLSNIPVAFTQAYSSRAEVPGMYAGQEDC